MGMEKEMTTEDDLHQTVPLSDFQEGQWWLLELQKHWSEGESSDETRRAAKVALNFAYSYFRQRDGALTEHQEQK
jgi:hypothetical protein